MIARPAPIAFLCIGAILCSGLLARPDAAAQSNAVSGYWDDRFTLPQLEGIYDVEVAGAEHVYVTGRVDLIPGLAAQGIARWDGETWHTLGSGIEGSISTMLIGPDGALYVGGDIERAGNVTGTNLVRWDGSEWSAAASHSGGVRTMTIMEDGVICAGFSLGHSGGYEGNNVECYGQNAPPPMPGMNAVFDLAAGRGDTLYARGSFRGFEPAFLGIWDGSVWRRDTLTQVLSIDYSSGELYAVTRPQNQPQRLMIKGADGWEEGPIIPTEALDVSAGNPIHPPYYRAGRVEGRPVVFRLMDGRWEIIAHSLIGSRMNDLSLDSDGTLYIAGSFEHAARPRVAAFT